VLSARRRSEGPVEFSNFKSGPKKFQAATDTDAGGDFDRFKS
jgi:hypothetical protein